MPSRGHFPPFCGSLHMRSSEPSVGQGHQAPSQSPTCSHPGLTPIPLFAGWQSPHVIQDPAPPSGNSLCLCVQESQAPAAPRMLLPRHRACPRKFGLCLPLNRAACSQQLRALATSTHCWAPAPWAPVTSSPTVQLVLETQWVRMDDGRSPNFCPVILMWSDLMGKVLCPRTTAANPGPKSTQKPTCWLPSPCELLRGSLMMVTAQTQLAQCMAGPPRPPQRVTSGPWCDCAYQKQLPRAAESHPGSYSHAILATRQLLVILGAEHPRAGC